MPDPHIQYTGEEHVLEHLRIATPPQVVKAPRLGAESISKMELNVQHLVDMDQLLVSLETYMLAEKLADNERTFHWEFADGPMQRWKERHPRLGKLLGKVRYHKAHATVKVRTWATYPRANYITDFGKPVIYQQTQALTDMDEELGLK